MTYEQVHDADRLLMSEAGKKSMRPRLFIFGAVGLVLLVIISFVIFFVARRESKFEEIKKACDPAGVRIQVVDDERTMLIDSVGETDEDGDLAVLICALPKLEIPRAVLSQMSGTAALDGRQQASWDGYRASWTYHPDKGLDIIIEKD